MLRHIERYGLARTRVVAVAKDMGMSHANVYRHFGSKAEILDAIVLAWLEQADEIIHAQAMADARPRERVRQIVSSLNRFLVAKLRDEPAAREVFAHTFSNQTNPLATHLAGLKIVLAREVKAHFAQAQAATSVAALTMDLLTTTLDSFLNPLQLADRETDNDAAQISMLIDRLMPDAGATSGLTAPS